MPFIRKKIHQGETGFGDDLAELRELRGYTRESLARLSGIHPAVIAALEENRLVDLTDPAYAERHVRVLANQLEGSVDFFIDKYQELMLKQGFSVEPREILRPRVRKRDLLVSSKLPIVLVSIVLVSLIGAYLVHQARQMSELPRLEIALPAEGQRLEVARVEVVGTTDPEAKVVVNSEQVLVAGDGSFRTSINVPPGLSTILIQARRRYSAPTTVERHVVFEREPPPEEPQAPAATTTTGELSATSTQ
jgi:transcriptional regulator with XRE-family HTH domain